MIASVLKLSRADCKNLKLYDAYGLHRVVYTLFPKQKDEDKRNFLFVDKGGDWNYRNILILSEDKPKDPEFGEVIYKEIPSIFLESGHYGFEVTLNPTQRNGKSKKTIPIRGRDNLQNWFVNKTPSLGFTVDTESLQVCRIGVQRFEKIKDGKKYIQTHSTATFIGKLTVTDRDIFIRSFKYGIGRAKGFGFGLLQLVPIQK